MISTAKHSLREGGVYTSASEPERTHTFFSSNRFFKLTQRLAVFVLMVSVLAGCDLFGGDDDDPELDEQLEAALVDAAPEGEGIEYYNMPASDDFNAIPQDPLNPVTAKKVELGQLLYHETALLVDNKLPEGRFTASCASCHNAKAGFQAGRIQGVGEGGLGFGERGEGRVNNPAYPIDSLDVQPIRSPSAMNGAYQIVNLWNGQFGATGPNVGTEASWTVGTPKENNNLGYEGLETQAIAGLGVHRMGDIPNTIAATDPTYTTLFAEAFPGQAEPANRENAGLAIAAFERTLLSNQAPFQRWLDGDTDAMTEQEKRGAIVFFTKAACADCHSGPALSSMTFYALGMNNLDGPGVYGDGPAESAGENLGRGGFTGNAADNYKFKTPQLYNLTDSPFFGHGGNFRSVREVVEYKNVAVAQNSTVPTAQLAAEFVPLGLTDDEVNDLVAFIETGLHDPNLDRYVPASTPSGNCLVVNDVQSQADLGC